MCLLALVGTYLAGQRSLVGGLVATLAVGYAYGIVRANALSTATYFLFDFSVLGLYAAQLFRVPAPGIQRASGAMQLWVFALCAWPIMLMSIPRQESLIQLVGLRTAIFLLPFLLLGPRLTSDDLNRLALWFGGLNLGAFAIAAAEFAFGLEPFLPRNAVTALNYLQSDVGSGMASRIPSSFPSAAAYGGTMVLTLPVLLGAWSQRERSTRMQIFLICALVATGSGVLVSASRTAAVLMFALIAGTVLSGRVRLRYRVGWLAVVGVVGFIALLDSRLQRVATLQDTAYVVKRLSWSMNGEFFTSLARYPFGNGLGGGGTNIPYFLQKRVRTAPVIIENEYARIALEEGIAGLALWVLFLMWVFFRRRRGGQESARLTKRLVWLLGVLFFADGLIGLGLLASIPGAALLLLFTGWLAGQNSPEALGPPPPTVIDRHEHAAHRSFR